MRKSLIVVLTVVLFRGCATRAENPGLKTDLLAQLPSIPLNVEGRIDHFAYDAKGQRLFLAALGNDTVEIVDLSAGKVAQQIKDLRTPQGVAFAPDLNRLAVANDKDGSCRIYDGASLAQLASVDLKDDADNVRYDAEKKVFWVGYGSGGLAEIDPQSGRVVADIKLDAHPESLQLESGGKRIFVNVTHAGRVAVIDREKRAVVAKWPIREAKGNFPMALDEANSRLFIGCRNPAKLLVMDTSNGKTVASLEIVGDTDDLFYDSARHCIYITGGEGRITVVNQTGADTYTVAGNVKTAAGARTSFFVPEARTLYVAVPHRGEQKSQLMVFRAADAR